METGERYDAGYEVSGAIGPSPHARHAEDDDFAQAGALYRVMKEEERGRLVETLADSLAQVSRQEVIDRSIGHFRRADPEYGRRVAESVAAKRAQRSGR